MRILIVEDSERRTDFLLRQCAGHEVAVATTAREAIKFLGKTTFDLLFLDYNLADSSGNGLDVARHLRTLGRADTPAIVHSEDMTAARAMVAQLPRSRAYPFFMLKDLADGHSPAEWITQCLSMCGAPQRGVGSDGQGCAKV